MDFRILFCGLWRLLLFLGLLPVILRFPVEVFLLMTRGDDGWNGREIFALVCRLGFSKGHRIEFGRDKTFPRIPERALRIAQAPVRFPCGLFFQYGYLFDRVSLTDRM